MTTATAVPFPEVQPPGFEWFDGEPTFDPAVHLQLEPPAETLTLAELGYSASEIAEVCTPFAASSPFRILSDEGVAVMLDTARRLRAHAISCERIENMVRGGCYRSKWLRDLCIAPELTEHLSAIYGIEVAPHSMPTHLGHLNFAPDDLSRAVDKWHHDTLALDFVMMVSDPATLDGGEFEYFLGTKDEAAELAERGETPPVDRRSHIVWPGPGYAVALHGDMVVHRGGPLNVAGERITMVNGYVALDTSTKDQARHVDLIDVDPDEELFTSWGKHVAWRAQDRLQRIVAGLEFGVSRDEVAAELERAVAEVNEAVEQIRVAVPNQHHYEK